MSTSQRLVDELPDIDVIGAFSAQKTKDLEKAQLKCLQRRCVKKIILPEGEAPSDTLAQRVRTLDGGLVEYNARFPLFGKPYTAMRDYGCGIAVELYLRFHLECAVRPHLCPHRRHGAVGRVRGTAPRRLPVLARL